DSLGSELLRSRRTASWGFIVLLVCGGLLGTLLMVAITVLADRDKQQGTSSKAAGAWEPVGKYAGRGRMQTPQFHVKSPVWRLKWSCQADETPAKKKFQVHVIDD